MICVVTYIFSDKMFFSHWLSFIKNNLTLKGGIVQVLESLQIAQIWLVDVRWSPIKESTNHSIGGLGGTFRQETLQNSLGNIHSLGYINFLLGNLEHFNCFHQTNHNMCPSDNPLKMSRNDMVPTSHLKVLTWKKYHVQEIQGKRRDSFVDSRKISYDQDVTTYGIWKNISYTSQIL